MMNIRDRLRTILAFRPIPTTFVALIVYASIYISTLLTDNIIPVPKPKLGGENLGLNVHIAYNDLHMIASSPHPYNSHQNDVVRHHILGRVQNITKGIPYAHVDDDLISNATFAYDGRIAYFEGNNVIVKIDGTSPELDGLLLSAHFDSVSTAPGATDDGMGVVTLIQLVQYFTKNRPKRTVVFNINNGEEDWLHGAHAFLEHPWLNLTSEFVNLEGAGAGGKPLLLRATSTRFTQAFSKVSHPHGNVISLDAFARGVVKSGTDYSVYTDASLRGLDLSFYKQRSKYHTVRDSIPSLRGKASLWTMMESALLVSKALIKDERPDKGEHPVYFDLFGEALAVFSLQFIFILNIVLLITGPIVVAALVFVMHSKHKLYWSKTGWLRFVAEIIVSASFTFLLGYLYASRNPFIVYSSSTSVFISCLAISYIGFYVTSEVFTYFHPVPQQKSLVLFEMYTLWWILLVVEQAVISNSRIGGLYFITFFHAATLAALLVALLEHLELPAAWRHRGPVRLMRDEEDEELHNNQPELSSERTPLLRANGRTVKESEIDEDNQMGLWLLQFLLAVPFPVILITHVGIMLMNSLGQTLGDGNKPLTVYLAISGVAFLSILPSAPFIHKFHRSVFAVVLVAAIATIIYNVLAFPFSPEAPLKVFFQQSIDLDTGSQHASLTGVAPWLQHYIMNEVSSWSNKTTNADIICLRDPLRAGLPMCSWESIPPSVSSKPYKDWVSVRAHSSGPGSGTLAIKAEDSRNCRIYFDQNITNFHVVGGQDRFQALYPLPKNGLSEVRLWSRTWDREFEVEVGWEGSTSLTGKVACQWAESGIPALAQTINFVPQWVLVTKRTDGLLEGWKKFAF